METSWSISPEKYFDTKFEYQERFSNEKFHGIQIQINVLSEQNKSEHIGLERRIGRNFQISMEVQGLIVAILGLLVTLHFVH